MRLFPLFLAACFSLMAHADGGGAEDILSQTESPPRKQSEKCKKEDPDYEKCIKGEGIQPMINSRGYGHDYSSAKAGIKLGF